MIREWIAFIVTGLVWGSSFLWIKVALEEISSTSLVTLRVGFGLAGMVIAMAVAKQAFPRDRKTFLHLFVLSIFAITLPFLLIAWGETRIDSGIASILNGTTTLFTILIAHLLLPAEKMNLSKAVGVLVGFTGVVVLMAPTVQNVDLMGNFWGYVAVLAASASYGFFSVYSRKFLPTVSGFTQMGTVLLFSFLSLTLLSSTPVANFALPKLFVSWVAVAWMGLLGTTTGFLCYFYLLRRWGASKASLVNLTFPVVGLFLGVLILDEAFDLRILIGTVTIISGIWIVKREPIRITASRIIPAATTK